MKKYLILDLETTGKTTHKRFCNPLDPRHSITLLAKKWQGMPSEVEKNEEEYEEGIPAHRLFAKTELENVKFMCGQNLKFDMLWFWENEDWQKYLINGGTVWDTQTVEYLLSGQRFGKRDLNTLAIKYGAKLKDDRIGEMFKAGKLANEIHPELLIPYAKADVDNTEIVMRGQAQLAKKHNMFPLIRVYMDHYLALAEMEFNGLYVDRDLAIKHTRRLQGEVEELKEKLSATAEELRWPGEYVEFNPFSLEHTSCLLFGGEIKTIQDRPTLDDEGNEQFYKTGKRAGELKTRKTRIDVRFVGLGHSPTLYKATQKASGYWAVGDEVLSKMNDETAEDFLKLRQLNKLLTTYFYSKEYTKEGKVKKITGMIPLIHKHTKCIHSEFQSALTATGRLSSRSPNIQNLPVEVLDIFCSRWGDDGVILDIDYSQLEVVVQAYITKCSKMIKDIEDGVDFHCKRLAYAENLSYDEVVAKCAESDEWKHKRKKAKAISFQKAYGAQPKSIAESTGIPLHVIEKVFAAEDMEYPEIAEYYAEVQRQVLESRTPTKDLLKIRDKASGGQIEKDGEYAAYGTYQSITGKLYSFNERAVMTKRGVFRYFSMPDIQDYPIQGTAADIVACQVGKLFRELIKHRDKCLLINEVHDSVILDVKKEHLDWTIETACAILTDVDSSFVEHFGVNFDVPIKVDYSVGRTWKEAKENG